MSTSVAELAPEQHPNDEPSIRGYLSLVSEMGDPDQQLWALDSYTIRRYRHDSTYVPAGDTRGFRAENEEFCDALVEFATDETASSSLLVRVSALERALEMGYQQETIQLLPQNLSYVRGGAQDIWMQTDSNDDTHEGRSYRYVAKTLAEAEGLRAKSIFPDLTEDDIERGNPDPDYNPVLSFAFLDKLAADASAGVSNDAITKFSPLINSMQKKIAAKNQLPDDISVKFKFWEDIANSAKLLEYGENYKQVFVDILRSQDEDSLESMRKLGDMYERASYANEAFPKRYQAGVKDGLRHIVADALYAVLDHTRNGGQTEAVLSLSKGSKGLSLKLGAGEPLELLRALQISFDTLGRLKTDWACWNGHYHPGFRNTTRVTESDKYGLYRYMTPKGTSNLSVYVRPYGGADYDPWVEYGRPYEGVEASIGYVIDTTKEHGTMPEIGRHRGNGDDGRISIRLDREGVAPDLRGKVAARDPLQQHGTLSLDVGSILGKDDWLSTKVGRFLAWGNTLRTQSMGTETHLNHTTEYFTAEDGDADVFANEAIQLAIELEKKRLTTKQVAELFAGQAAVGAAK